MKTYMQQLIDKKCQKRGDATRFYEGVVTNPTFHNWQNGTNPHITNIKDLLAKNRINDEEAIGLLEYRLQTIGCEQTIKKYEKLINLLTK